MTKTLFSTLALALTLAAAPAFAADAPKHELVVSASISKGFVIGSKILTPSGLYRRAADGTFQHFGFNHISITAVTYDPRDPRVLYTAALNGCLRSPDAGKTWRITTDWDLTEPKDVSVDPNAPDHVYIGVPDGILVSRDQAKTWTRAEQGLPARGKFTKAMQVDRTRAGRVLAGCEKGIFLTDDGAKSWRRVLATTETVDDIQQSPHDPKFWVAVTQADGAFASHDGGASWTKLAGVPSAQALYNVAFDPGEARRLVIGSWTYGVLVSEDAGQTWTERNTGLPTGHRVWRVALDPDRPGRLYAGVSEEALFTSDDLGRTWRRDGLEGSVIHTFVFLPIAAAK